MICWRRPAYALDVIVGESSTSVGVTRADVIEFVLDLNRYRQADRKIGRVGPVHRDGDSGTVKFWGRIRGLPGPAGVYPFAITPSGLRIGSPTAGAARWFLDFEGTFECDETADGTVVTHREIFTFKRPWSWFVEPMLKRWLTRDTADEMIRFKELIERR